MTARYDGTTFISSRRYQSRRVIPDVMVSILKMALDAVNSVFADNDALICSDPDEINPDPENTVNALFWLSRCTDPIESSNWLDPLSSSNFQYAVGEDDVTTAVSELLISRRRL